MGYEQLDKDGKTTYVFHSPPQIFCNDTACPCNLPSEAQQAARDRADGRNDWFVQLGRGNFKGPFPEAEAREVLATHLSVGRTPKLLRVVEDYDA